MPVLTSYVINLRVTGVYSITRTRPQVTPSIARVGDTLGIVRGTYSEGTGAFNQRWVTDLGPIDGATGLTFTIAPEYEGMLLGFEEQTFNSAGNPLPWVRSNLLLVEPAEVVPGGEWSLDGTYVLTAPDGPTVHWTVNGSYVDYEVIT